MYVGAELSQKSALVYPQPILTFLAPKSANTLSMQYTIFYCRFSHITDKWGTIVQHLYGHTKTCVEKPVPVKLGLNQIITGKKGIILYSSLFCVKIEFTD